MMWKRRGLAWAASLWLGVTASTAAQAQTACIPQREAEALSLVVLPGVIDAASRTCAAHLPATALLRNPERVIASYRSASEKAWPLALQGFVKLSGPEVGGFLQGEAGKAMLLAMITPMLASMVKPEDCASADRILNYLTPLPPANTAGLLVTIYDLSQNGRAKNPLQICKAAR